MKLSRNVIVRRLKLSLKSRTRMRLALMLLGFIALGLLAINRLASVSHESTVMNMVWSPRSRAAEQLAGAARDYRISEAQRILSVTPDMADHADQDLKDNADQFETDMAAYRRLLGPHDSAAALDNIDALWSSYVSGNQQMLQFAKDNKMDDAADRFRNSASKFYLVSNALSDLSDYNTQQSALASTTATRIYEQAQYMVIAALCVAFVLSIMNAMFFERQVWGVLVRLAAVMKKLAEADFTPEVVGADRMDEVGEMARAVQVFKDNGLEMRRLEQDAEAQRGVAAEARRQHDETIVAVEAKRSFVVSSIAAGLAELSGGNLTYRLSEDFAPEFEKLRTDFNTAVENLQETMKVIALRAVGIQSGTEEITQASDDLARRTEKQAASLEEVAAALEEATTTVRTSAEGARQANSAVAQAKSNAERSAEVVRGAVAAMSEIERSAGQISDIIGIMDEIAFQTNLLALNAGVEAARAGDAGKGFAVVAQEVRALAQRSAVAAKEIKALISSSSQQVGAGVTLVGETGKALQLIAAQVSEINGAVADIARAAQEQATGLVQINTSVSQMDQVTQQNAAVAEESTAASHSLAQEAVELARLIGRFKLGGSAALDAGQPGPQSAPHRGRATLRTVPSGRGAQAVKLENAHEDWEEF